jgi:hypothetical protein
MSTTVSSLLETITPFPAPAKTRLDTVSWFDRSHATTVQSPVDEFRSNLSQINMLYLQADGRGEYKPVLGSLVYLGMVSAAESYFRSLLRRLILIDPACQHNASGRTVTYGAAVHHAADLLPEALLEGLSLASTKNVAFELKSLCNISHMSKDGGVPAALEQLFYNFEAICQVRHCGIHRFGKLGSQQALRLGMDQHKPLLEKPLALTVQHLQDIAEALEALVRAVNSYCFADILKKTHTAGPTGRDKPLYQAAWELDWVLDEKRFTTYYEIFASFGGSRPSATVREVYDAFIHFVSAYGAAKKK